MSKKQIIGALEVSENIKGPWREIGSVVFQFTSNNKEFGSPKGCGRFLKIRAPRLRMRKRKEPTAPASITACNIVEVYQSRAKWAAFWRWADRLDEVRSHNDNADRSQQHSPKMIMTLNLWLNQKQRQSMMSDVRFPFNNSYWKYTNFKTGKSEICFGSFGPTYYGRFSESSGCYATVNVVPDRIFKTALKA